MKKNITASSIARLLELRAAEYMAGGMDEEQARRAAVLWMETRMETESYQALKGTGKILALT